ncbi:MAG: transporter [Rhodanobacteraceae bacterium]|nr:transporter [Rhodanobacteraceae bacterium]
MGSQLLAFCALLGLIAVADAQDIEPRAYSNAPIGVNFLVAGYAYTQGALSFDPALSLTDADLRTNNAVIGYARVLNLGGKSGIFDLTLPYTFLSGEAIYEGEPVERQVDGMSNPAFRLSWNFYGAPAMGLGEFRTWQQDLVIGASLRVSAPWSQYDSSRLVNIGTNRWSFKPELGISKTLGQWTVEGQLAATIYTENDDFFGGNTRKQDPIYSAQAHTIYGFKSGKWASFDLTWFGGGRTTFNGVDKQDLQQNWRLGATFAVPVNRKNSVKFYASSGVSDRTGNSYDLIGIVWQYRWGGGL